MLTVAPLVRNGVGPSIIETFLCVVVVIAIYKFDCAASYIFTQPLIAKCTPLTQQCTLSGRNCSEYIYC